MGFALGERACAVRAIIGKTCLAPDAPDAKGATVSTPDSQITTPQPQATPSAQPLTPAMTQSMPSAPLMPPVPPQQPVYQAPPAQAYAQAAAPRRVLPTTLAQTNTFALIAIIVCFVQPIAGIVFGHLALAQLKRTGDVGRPLALTGLIVGYVFVGFAIIGFLITVSTVGIYGLPYVGLLSGGRYY